MTEQKPLFCVGDIVRIKSLEEIEADIGGKHNALCGWCMQMDRAAGNEYEVVEVLKSTSGGFHYSYRFDGTGMYWFSEDVLEALKMHQNSSVMSFEEFMNGGVQI